MQEYSSKKELIDEINKRAVLFINEFIEITDENKDTLVEGVDRGPAQMIAYQLGWMNLILLWEEKNKNDEDDYAFTLDLLSIGQDVQNSQVTPQAQEIQIETTSHRIAKEKDESLESAHHNLYKDDDIPQNKRDSNFSVDRKSVV